MNEHESTALLPIAGAVQQYWDSIDECLKTRRVLPALTLTYCMIDSLAWLGSERPGRIRFIEWVEKRLLSRGNLSCTAMDLYAARCAILHTMTSDSHLSDQGKAKRILYYQGKRMPSEIHDILADDPDQFCALSVDVLVDEVKQAGAAFLGRLDSDPEFRAMVVNKAQRFYAIYPDFLMKGYPLASLKVIMLSIRSDIRR